MPVRVAIIGTGTMGGRMLAEMARHPEFEPTWAWDSSPRVRDATAAEYPSLEFSEEIFAQPADLFYIATPPATHIPLARQASRAILCEKPLAIDVTEARHLVDEIQIPNAVNFPFATHPTITTLEHELAEERHGSTVRLEIRLSFNDWPRQWQQGAASWLAQPDQGGFLREVFSHFAYLTDRILGTVELIEAEVERGPTGTESTVRAQLQAGDVPILLTGDVGGSAPDYNEWTLYGSKASYRTKTGTTSRSGTTTAGEIFSPTCRRHKGSKSSSTQSRRCCAAARIHCQISPTRYAFKNSSRRSSPPHPKRIAPPRSALKCERGG